jgi:heme oxygenase
MRPGSTLQTIEMAAPNTAPSMRQALRHHTTLLHQTLDSLPALSSLLKAELSVTDYRRTLNGYALAFACLEGDLALVEMTLFLGKVPTYVPRLPALVHDLDELNRWTGTPSRVSRQKETSCRIHTELQYWGARYVLDGATRGSEFIALQLRKHLPQLEPHAFEFWKLQLGLAQDWTAVCDRLSQSAPTGSFKKQMLSGADIAFNTFIRCFGPIERTRNFGA